PGMHMLTAVQGDVRRTVRVMATEGNGGANLLYIGGSERAMPKSDRVLFTWTSGDELRYIGYATSGGVLHSAAIDEVPVTSATRTFVMVAGATCPDAPTITDIDGNVYSTVQIGSQCWMAGNLRASQDRDGNPIPSVTDNIAWSQLSTAAWGNYGNDPANDAIYGKLYNWYAAANPALCPQGWHVSTEAEWQQLELFLGMPAAEVNTIGVRGVAEGVGGLLKATQLWNAVNAGATNGTGFTGLPGGYRFSSTGSFDGLGTSGTWWTATESGPQNAFSRALFFSSTGVDRVNSSKRPGFCVRCVRD
ncbi:MAG: fibrobacter succinogenes major paralogous domain-containing protein, partial [Flavobacteriales bacterium]